MITKSLKFLTLILLVVSCKDAKTEKIPEVNTPKEVVNTISDSTESTQKTIPVSGDFH